MYTIDSILSKRRKNSEMPDSEFVCVDITIKSKTILGGGFYRQSHSNIDYFNKINERQSLQY